jgi:hypothetical protein
MKIRFDIDSAPVTREATASTARGGLAPAVMPHGAPGGGAVCGGSGWGAMRIKPSNNSAK